MRYIVSVFTMLIAGQVALAQAETILERYREHLFIMGGPEPDRIEALIGTLNADQQWPDIDYKDKVLANWKVSHHLRRVVEISWAWANPESPYYHSEAAWNTIEAGLDHWLDKRYQNSNWWHNQIGVPQLMRDIIILLGDHLPADQRHGALEVLAQHNVLGPGAGANLIWSADLGFHYGALTNDLALMKKCRDLMVNEIMISTGEGVQPDYSYHQHGNRLQMYQYGRAYLLDNVRLAWQLMSTPLAFPEAKVDILTNFILKGWQWMARGINTVPGTMDRSVSRRGELRSADIRKFIPYLCELKPGKTADFKALEDRQNGKGSLKGFRYYPYSDFSAYHHSDFSFFLKTISERTLPTESINSENLKGHLLHSGDAYLIRNGNEYYNLMPVWDWEKLPGVTSFKGADHINRKAFVGSVANGHSGLSVMDYQIRDKDLTKSLSAHKFWAAHGNIVVCLMADLKPENIGDEIYTALDQCRWTDGVVVNAPGKKLNEGVHVINNAKWLYHAGIAYIPIDASTLEIHLREKVGAWYDVNRAESTAPVREKIFMPVLKHNPEKKSTGYVLAACTSARKAKKLVSKKTWQVLRNDQACQAVKFEDGTTMVAFFSPDTLKIGEDVLKVDQPCLLIISHHELFASDPAHQGGTINIQWKNEEWQIALDQEGFTRKVSLDGKKGEVQ